MDFTIGMAGHIDHGKTTLTKALTNVDTDRLKAEKERNISIELGFAPLKTKDGTQISIVDVPGHEQFIRQMIAGVAGIDLVVLVIAADEGVMPQTKEHLEILEFLGIEHCVIAVSKIDQVEEELIDLVEEDIKEGLAGSIFQEAPFVYVDSVSDTGIDQLKEMIFTELESVRSRDVAGSFRLPIDQVFTIQGKGTIIRGTVYEGNVQTGSQLTLLPAGQKVKARQIQVHSKVVENARAGQRTAINLGGVDKADVERGDVLVDSDHFISSETIDVALNFVETLAAPLKQRAPVRVYVGTSEVTGKIVFFDRNEVKQGGEEVLCQIRLEKPVVIRRGDRLIVRRPTPIETLAGGWIIEPNGKKYRFGEETMEWLQQIKVGTPEDRIFNVLAEHKLLDKKQLIQLTSIDQDELDSTLASLIDEEAIFEVPGNKYTSRDVFNNLKEQLVKSLESYHATFPMRLGMEKAELVQNLNSQYPKLLIDFCLDTLADRDELEKSKQFIAAAGFEPHLPKEWKIRMEQLIGALERDEMKPKNWDDYVSEAGIAEEVANELKAYLIHTELAFQLTDNILIHETAFKAALTKLQEGTDTSFKLNDAKDILDISRKYLIPFLELLDALEFTIRKDDGRVWRNNR